MTIDFTKEELELVQKSLLKNHRDLVKFGLTFEGELKDLTHLIDKIKQHTSDQI